MPEIVQINAKDNVAVALRPLAKGETVFLEGGSVTVREDIPQGHKIALRFLQTGENVIKYGFPIGHVTEAVEAGRWLHTHNMTTNLSGVVDYAWHPADCTLMSAEPRFFNGFVRRDGKVGIRNEVWIIPTVGCVNDVAAKLVQDNRDLLEGTTVEGLYTFPHPYGCSQTGADHAQTRKLLAALARHPNAGAILVLSLGCENLTREQFVEELGTFDPERIHFLTCQDTEDEFAAGRELLRRCVAFAGQFKREPLPASRLVVGLKCGGSDGLSGITANPAVGRFSDLLIAQGGSTILTEVPEMFGAEEILLNRCTDEAVFGKAVRMLNGFKEYFLSHHEVVYENPSPGNKQGGITTLEDKSCGCVQKGGSAPVTDVIGYGEPVTRPGLSLLYGPGNDLVSCTALTAAGAHLILFTTGRGTPFGSPVPTLKISSNTGIAQKKPGWIDFNAGTAAEGESLNAVGERLLELVLSTASGTPAKNEKNGFRSIAIFKDGVCL